MSDKLLKSPLPLILSERGDSNARPLRPERSALPTALLSVVCGCKGTYFLRKYQMFYENFPFKC